MTTQEILQSLYDAVIDKLYSDLKYFNEIFAAEEETLNNLAEEFNLDVADPLNLLDEEDRWHTAKVALRPVAQKCVVTMLRELIKQCERPQYIAFSKERMSHIWNNNAFNWETFPRSVGLNMDEARFAVDAAARVLQETNLFRSPAVLTMSGMKYEIRHDVDGLRVQKTDLQQGSVQTP